MIKKKEVFLLKLDPLFFRVIFNKLVTKFDNPKKASEFLEIPYSSFRAYRNGYFSSLSEKLAKKILNAGIISKKEFKKNILSTYSKEKRIKEILDKGRQRRFNQLKLWKEEVPKINKILRNNTLDFEKWFFSYKKLINFGVRKFNYIKQKSDYLEVSYTTHSNKKKKEFILKFPRKIKLDADFIYFLGLWCGDRSGGKRFGIINKENSLIDFSHDFLKKLFQRTSKFLYIKRDEIVPDLDYDKKIIIKSPGRGWAISTHSNNGILTSFFYYLLENIEELFEHLDLSIFFAGLFDAEGNVSLYNKSFRWACKNERLVKIYSNFLKKLDLYDSYDGANIITKNKKSFYEKILPCLKHKEKINNSLFLCSGKGELPLELEQVLDYIKNNPLKTQKEISKALKKSKVYSELGLLREFGFILAENYPLRFKLNNKNKLSGGN